MYDVRSSERREDWEKALNYKNDKALKELIRQEPPGVIFFEIMIYINGRYLKCIREKKPYSVVTPDVNRVLGILNTIRDDLGPYQRDIDLGILRSVRRASALSIVVGAGATINAGGPYWSEFVQKLLTIANSKGNEIKKWVEAPGNTKDSF